MPGNASSTSPSIPRFQATMRGMMTLLLLPARRSWNCDARRNGPALSVLQYAASTTMVTDIPPSTAAVEMSRVLLLEPRSAGIPSRGRGSQTNIWLLRPGSIFVAGRIRAIKSIIWVLCSKKTSSQTAPLGENFQARIILRQTAKSVKLMMHRD